MQDKLYAQDRWSVLLVFQAMDAAGKDGAIKHVMSGVNPQGCQVFSFKQPSAEELDHDFLWRYAPMSCPSAGRIGIFNRSYYEEVLVVRVHPEILDAQKLPASVVHPRTSGRRRVTKTSTATSGTLTKRRGHPQVLSPRLEGGAATAVPESARTSPDKNWKFSLADTEERNRWDDYQTAYEEAIPATPPPRTRRGSSSPPITSGSPGWSLQGAAIDARGLRAGLIPRWTPTKRAELKLVVELEPEVGAQGQAGKKAPGRPSRASGASEGKKGKKGKQGKGSGAMRQSMVAARSGRRRLAQRDSRTAHRAVGTEGRGATTGRFS